MGTPDFALPCLRRILEDGHEVAGVFTQPDKPRGRSGQPRFPPVKELALAHGLPVYQPVKLRDGEACRLLQSLAPDLVVVVAYGRILPPELLAAPPMGCVNIHGSLLPKYRGAAPIQWSVINGDAVSGVTSMFMAEGLDTGDMILQKELAVGPDETSGELFDRLAALGADCLAETLALFAAGPSSVPRAVQDDAQASYAPMLEKTMGELDFTKSAKTLHNLVRGMSPWPGAYTRLEGKLLKVHAARPVEGPSGRPGTLLEDGGAFTVACGEGALRLLTVQLEGKSRLEGQEFLRGRRLQPGIKLG